MDHQFILPIHLVERRKKLGIKHTSFDWPLSILFGKPILEHWVWSVDMCDFEMEHYIYFLDHVENREQLVSGLQELSPFADDALSVAEWMSDLEFAQFREIVPRHHQAVREGIELDESILEQFLLIMLPELFIHGIPIAEKGITSLGVGTCKTLGGSFLKEKKTLIFHI